MASYLITPNFAGGDEKKREISSLLWAGWMAHLAAAPSPVYVVCYYNPLNQPIAGATMPPVIVRPKIADASIVAQHAPSAADIDELMNSYDKNDDGRFSRAEVKAIVYDLKRQEARNRRIWRLVFIGALLFLLSVAVNFVLAFVANEISEEVRPGSQPATATKATKTLMTRDESEAVATHLVRTSRRVRARATYANGTYEGEQAYTSAGRRLLWITEQNVADVACGTLLGAIRSLEAGEDEALAIVEGLTSNPNDHAHVRIRLTSVVRNQNSFRTSHVLLQSATDNARLNPHDNKFNIECGLSEAACDAAPETSCTVTAALTPAASQALFASASAASRRELVVLDASDPMASGLFPKKSVWTAVLERNGH